METIEIETTDNTTAVGASVVRNNGRVIYDGPGRCWGLEEAEGVAFFCDTQVDLLGFDADGERIWRVEQEPDWGVAQSEHRKKWVVMGTLEGPIRVLNGSTGETAYTLPGKPSSCAYSGPWIIEPLVEGELSAYSKSDGTQLWSTSDSTESGCAFGDIYYNYTTAGTLQYIRTDDGTIVCERPVGEDENLHTLPEELQEGVGIEGGPEIEELCAR